MLDREQRRHFSSKYNTGNEYQSIAEDLGVRYLFHRVLLLRPYNR